MAKDLASLVKSYNALLRIIVLGLVVAAVLLIVSMFYGGEGALEKVCFKDDICVDVIFVADNDATRAKGLMGHDVLEPMTGMMFVFPDERPRTFWMKNMEFPIDIIFVSKSKRVVSISKDAQPCLREPCELFDSEQGAQYVLEVPVGFAEEYNIYEANNVKFVYAKK